MIIIVLTYFFLIFLLPNQFFFNPYDPDDYANLVPNPLHLGFSRPRPVSTLIIDILAYGGKDIYYLTLNLFALFYPPVVLLFVAKFSNRKLSFLRVVIFTVLVFSSISFTVDQLPTYQSMLIITFNELGNIEKMKIPRRGRPSLN